MEITGNSKTKGVSPAHGAGRTPVHFLRLQHVSPVFRAMVRTYNSETFPRSQWSAINSHK